MVDASEWRLGRVIMMTVERRPVAPAILATTANLDRQVVRPGFKLKVAVKVLAPLDLALRPVSSEADDVLRYHPRRIRYDVDEVSMGLTVPDLPLKPSTWNSYANLLVSMFKIPSLRHFSPEFFLIRAPPPGGAEILPAEVPLMGDKARRMEVARLGRIIVEVRYESIKGVESDARRYLVDDSYTMGMRTIVDSVPVRSVICTFPRSDIDQIGRCFIFLPIF